MLSPLQEQVAAIIAALDEAKYFALAGGAALILRGETRALEAMLRKDAEASADRFIHRCAHGVRL